VRELLQRHVLSGILKAVAKEILVFTTVGRAFAELQRKNGLALDCAADLFHTVLAKWSAQGVFELSKAELEHAKKILSKGKMKDVLIGHHYDLLHALLLNARGELAAQRQNVMDDALVVSLRLNRWASEEASARKRPWSMLWRK
jgi:hypothetical protein